MAKLRLFASLILVVLMALPVFAGDESAGTVGGAFLKLGNGVRAPAMGEAFTAVADDASAIYWNPAGIAKLDSPEISMSYNMWLQSTSYSTVHYVHPILPGHTLGASIFYLNYGNIMETTATSRTGTGRIFSPSGSVATISYASNINDSLSLGANLKVLGQSIDMYQENGTAVDLGLLLKNPRGMDIGLVAQNLGVMNGSSLPQTWKLGVSKKLLDDKMLIALDIGAPTDNKTIVSLGCEYQLNQLLKLRAGYNTKSEEGAGGNLGMGLGLNLSRFSVDYTYAPYGELGSAHRVGLRFKL
ncbi:MAG: PorV/PorQ family protein [Candidatus Margulisbacteria bacterium]|nr:PorV/PorQ family protein [Candidatus Margulisiibacteriota bacterium]